jgi:hypothetical protein
MSRLGNLCASHLQHSWDLKQPMEDMSLNTFRAELTKLHDNLQSPFMRRKLFKETLYVRTLSRTPQSDRQRTTTPQRTPHAAVLPIRHLLGLQSIVRGKKKLSPNF